MSTFHANHPITQRLALIVGIGVFVVVVFGASFSSMWDLWQTSDHRHGLLVIPISAFLIWRLRYHLLDLPIAPDPRGLLLVAPLALVWLVARLAGIQVVEHIAALAMIPAGVVTLAGWGIANKLLFPLLFLLLATPLGESLVPYLMVITADISTALLKISGFPVLRNGQYISLPGGEFVVADVCAGLRYLVSGVMISTLFGYLTYSSVRKRLVLVIVTAVTMIITNGVRAYIVMAVASATRLQYFGGRDHIYFGWLMFGVVIMIIMWIGARFADDLEPRDPDLSDTVAIRASPSILPIIVALGLSMLAVTLAPLQADFVGQTGAIIAAVVALFAFLIVLVRYRSSDNHSESGRSKSAVLRIDLRHALTAVAGLVILVITPRLATEIETRAVDLVEDFELKSIVPCTFVGPWQNDWEPGFQGPDVESAVTFACDDQLVSVYVAAYASALQGNELISSSHNVVPPEWDRISAGSSYTIRDRSGRQHRVGEIRVDAPAHKALIWYWYEIDDRMAVSPLMAKVYQVLALITGRPAGGRVVVMETLADPDIQRARERLEFVGIGIIETDSR